VRYGGACDWWSIGVLLCELLCGDTPFQDESLLKVYRNIRQHDVRVCVCVCVFLCACVMCVAASVCTSKRG
jgi:hypothetical protein